RPKSSMTDVTQLLDAAAAGDARAAADLLPVVYDELRRLAATRLAGEKPGHTLDATALVHEAYLRLVGDRKYEGPRHFFAVGVHVSPAAAGPRRRTAGDPPRRKRTQKRGGEGARVPLDPEQLAAPERADDLLALDEALDQLARSEPQAAELVKLRYFAGLTIP